jgi:transposase
VDWRSTDAIVAGQRDPEKLASLAHYRVQKSQAQIEALESSLAAHLKRILEVDLTTIPGLDVLAVLTLVSEIGTNMAKWRHEKAFVSWLGLTPTTRSVGSGC